MLDRDGGNYTTDDFRQAIEARDAQLWLMVDDGEPLAAGISEIATYPRRKVCRIRGVAGHSFDRWHPTLTQFEAWARQQGCDGIEFYARKGWERLLPDYRQTAIVMEKTL